MSNGWLAQPGVFLFNRESGRFTPREQGNYKPQYPNARDSSGSNRRRMSTCFTSRKESFWRGACRIPMHSKEHDTV